MVVPAEVDSAPAGQRTYDFFKAMCSAMKNEYGKIARSKIKELREALKQGEVESMFFLRDKRVQDLLYHGFDALYRTDQAKAEAYRELIRSGQGMRKEAFVNLDGSAIEMIDHCDFLEVTE